MRTRFSQFSDVSNDDFHANRDSQLPFFRKKKFCLGLSYLEWWIFSAEYRAQVARPGILIASLVSFPVANLCRASEGLRAIRLNARKLSWDHPQGLKAIYLISKDSRTSRPNSISRFKEKALQRPKQSIKRPNKVAVTSLRRLIATHAWWSNEFARRVIR